MQGMEVVTFRESNEKSWRNFNVNHLYDEE